MPSPLLQNRRVLVVEDEYLVASYLEDAFVDEGARVLGPASTVDAALELIDSGEAIDVAVLDVNLGGEPVFAVADRLIERHVPFVFTSGYDASAFPERYRHLPMCLKPVDVATVTQVLARL